VKYIFVVIYLLEVLMYVENETQEILRCHRRPSPVFF